METVSGKLHFKFGDQFILRTVGGNIALNCIGPVPGINIGDMIVVVVDRGIVLSIHDVTIGLDYLYRPCPPFRKETMHPLVLVVVFFAILLIPIISHEFRDIGWDIASAYGAMWWELSILIWFTTWWRRVKNFNVKLASKISALSLNAVADPKIWDIEHVR